MKYAFKRSVAGMAWLILAGLFATLPAVCVGAEADETSIKRESTEGDTTISEVDAAIATGDLVAAAKSARALDSAADPSIDLTMVMARLGRAFQKAGDLESATEFYTIAAFASEQPAAGSTSAEKLVFVRLAAAASMAQSGRLSDSLRILKTIADATSAATPAQVQSAATIGLQIGGAALADGNAAIAAEAYSIAASVADANQRPTAMLGAAWAIAISQQDPVEAAKKLALFVRDFPDHADAARATRACAECLRQAGRLDDSAAMIADLLNRWPDSQSAAQVVSSYTSVKPESVPPSVRNWLMRVAESDNLSLLGADMTRLGIAIANPSDESKAWTNLAIHLTQIDPTGKGAGDVLVMMCQNGKADAAERLATALITSTDDPPPTTATREAACRWAGRTERWSMLAMASESELENLDSPSSTRSITVERLFAESLMQTGRVAEASQWWNHLVDSRQATDFATLLRCAEAETSVGKDTGLASQRIALARTAAGGNAFNETLVDMLGAELAIRKTRFEEARSLLESVVRATQIDAALRGRAQWLIGETHYLQAQFSEAIEAYRRVEGIDPGGNWVSASLVQAGKSFEQLGRTREAAVCYGSLIGRFADSPHAQLARQRMASIDPAASSSNSTIRR